jgi:TonB family protein
VVPPALAKRKLTGRVRFALAVGPDGKPTGFRILAASHPDFVLPAMAMLPQWTFVPAQADGQPVAAVYQGMLAFDQAVAPPGQILAANQITGSDGQATQTPPVPEILVDPVWPYALLLAGVGGEVVADFTVLENGLIGEIRVRSEARPEFGRALAAAIGTWRFQPLVRGGVPRAVALEKRAVFRLRGKAPGLPEDPGLARLVTEARQGRIGTAKDLDRRLTPLYQVSPVYPATLCTAGGPGGRAEIAIVVSRDGRVRLPRIATASRDEFGWAAATAVSQWVFAPPMRGGERVDVSVVVPFVFAPPSP